MYFQHDGAPNITLDTWETTWMNPSLTAGEFVVGPLHGHRGRQMLRLLFITSGATWKH